MKDFFFIIALSTRKHSHVTVGKNYFVSFRNKGDYFFLIRKNVFSLLLLWYKGLLKNARFNEEGSNKYLLVTDNIVRFLAVDLTENVSPLSC